MDYDYKYELAKAYYMEGEYSQASSLLEDVLAFMKGTIYAELNNEGDNKETNKTEKLKQFCIRDMIRKNSLKDNLESFIKTSNIFIFNLFSIF